MQALGCRLDRVEEVRGVGSSRRVFKVILELMWEICRRAVGSVRRVPRQRVAFIHVQKCAGSSVGQALREVYQRRTPGGVRVLDVKASFAAARVLGRPVAEFRSELLLYYLAQPTTRLITGHFPFVATAAQGPGEDFAFVTILRNPVRRWISAFLFSAAKPAGKHGRIEPDIDAFLATDRARAMGHTMIDYFGERQPDEGWETALPRALENISLFRAVGTLEELPAFREKIQSLVGRRVVIRRRNRTVAPDHLVASASRPEVLEKVRELCQPDLEFYSRVGEIHGWSELDSSY